MSEFSIACLWCVLQVTLLSGIGIAISLLLARRLPSLAAASTAAVVAMLLVATLLVPFRLPTWSLPKIAAAVQPAPTDNTVTTEAAHENETSGGFSINLDAVADWAATAFSQQQTHNVSTNSTFGWLRVVAIGALCVGLFRFAIALISLARIRRRSSEISDVQACQTLSDLSKSMACLTPVRLRVSADIASPAVLGWFRPVILLPTNWQAWDTPQLQAVLAHELAHVRRSDFFFRVLAILMRAFHFYHPLTHWLLKRLAYSQELAADQLAAAALGNRLAYCKALSQLALGQDQHSRLRAESILLPTLSSFLIRRIEMLRATECKENSRLHRMARVATIGFIVLLGTTTIAMRGLAQTEEPQNEPTKQQKSTDSPASKIAKQTPQFNRPPIDLSIAGENEEGMFAVNIGELLKQPALRSYVPLLNSYVNVLWEDSFAAGPDAPKVDFDLSALEYIAGQATISITPKTDELGSIQMGSSYVVLRFKQDLSDWKKWISQSAPLGAVQELNGQTFIAFQDFFFNGEEVVLVVDQVDKQTLMLSWSPGMLTEHAWHYKQKGAQPQLTQNSTPAHTGLACLHTSLASSKAELAMLSIAMANPENRILTHAHSLGWDLDWSDDFQQLGVRVQLVCEGDAAASEIIKAIREMVKKETSELQQSLSELSNDPENEMETEEKRKDLLLTQQVIDSLKIQTSDVLGDAKQIEFRIQLGYSLTEVFDQMTGMFDQMPSDHSTHSPYAPAYGTAPSPNAPAQVIEEAGIKPPTPSASTRR